MKKKYLVCPGEIISQNDGDKHYITAHQLINLYKVNPKDCKLIIKSEDALGLKWEDYIVLRPRTDGKYESPEPISN